MLKREDREGKKERRRGEPPRRQLQIAAKTQQRPERRHAAGVAALLLVGFEGAELDAGAAHGLGGGEAGPLEILGAPANMFAQLVAQLALESRARQE